MHLHIACNASEESVEMPFRLCASLAMLLHRNNGMSVLSMVARLHFRAVMVSSLLQTIADAKYGHAVGEDVWVNVRRIVVVDRVRTAGQDDACVRRRLRLRIRSCAVQTFWLPLQLRHLLRTRKHLAVDLFAVRPPRQ